MSKFVQAVERFVPKFLEFEADFDNHRNDYTYRLNKLKSGPIRLAKNIIHRKATNVEIDLLYIISGYYDLLCDNAKVITVNNIDMTNAIECLSEVHKSTEYLVKCPYTADDLDTILKSLKTNRDFVFSHIYQATTNTSLPWRNLKNIYSNVLVVIHSLKRDGSAIIRLNLPISYTLLSFVALLEMRFRSVNLVKPPIGSPINTKVYAVCRGYKGCPESVYKDLISRFSTIEEGLPLYDNETILKYTKKHLSKISNMLKFCGNAISSIQNNFSILPVEHFSVQKLKPLSASL
jgi:hypothetical protein